MSVMPVTKSFAMSLPPLRPGDCLDRATFHARYSAMPPGIRAELIEGIVYMPSPVGSAHSGQHALIMGWMTFYVVATQGLGLHDNPTVILADDSEPQPDAALRLLQGKSTIMQVGKTDYISGPPELVVEVAYISESVDLHAKRRDYERYGVSEYVVLQVQTERLLWFVRDAGRFVEMAQPADGILRSRVFPGLWLDPEALIAGDLRRIQEVVNQGVATPEHATFAARIV